MQRQFYEDYDELEAKTKTIEAERDSLQEANQKLTETNRTVTEIIKDLQKAKARMEMRYSQREGEIRNSVVEDSSARKRSRPM
jgi:exonuclease VII small subunit